MPPASVPSSLESRSQRFTNPITHWHTFSLTHTFLGGRHPAEAGFSSIPNEEKSYILEETGRIPSLIPEKSPLGGRAGGKNSFIPGKYPMRTAMVGQSSRDVSTSEVKEPADSVLRGLNEHLLFQAH